jgi:hypothetical protein
MMIPSRTHARRSPSLHPLAVATCEIAIHRALLDPVVARQSPRAARPQSRNTPVPLRPRLRLHAADNKPVDNNDTRQAAVDLERQWPPPLHRRRLRRLQHRGRRQRLRLGLRPQHLLGCSTYCILCGHIPHGCYQRNSYQSCRRYGSIHFPLRQLSYNSVDDGLPFRSQRLTALTISDRGLEQMQAAAHNHLRVAVTLTFVVKFLPLISFGIIAGLELAIRGSWGVEQFPIPHWA